MVAVSCDCGVVGVEVEDIRWQRSGRVGRKEGGKEAS
jgi:hypothetical protein